MGDDGTLVEEGVGGADGASDIGTRGRIRVLCCGGHVGRIP